MWFKMADSGDVVEFSGVVISDTEPANPWSHMLWVDSTNQRLMIYVSGAFQRWDVNAIDASAFLPSDDDASTTGSLTAGASVNATTDVNAGGDANIEGVAQIQDGAPIGKITITTTAGQPAGGAYGDIVMVHN
jgi:hypothetical protein